MVRIIKDSTDSCTCLMCMETKSIYKISIEYKSGGGYINTMCPDCIKKFAKELNDEVIKRL